MRNTTKVFLKILVLQVQSALFALLLIAGIIFSSALDFPLGGFYRYDWLFFWAIGCQIFLLWTGREKPKEILIISVFHVLGTMMELYKTSPEISAWHYPGEGIFRIANVPLFSGFMYASVGSYISGLWKSFDIELKNCSKKSTKESPSLFIFAIISLLAYGNFFTHHFWWDMRWWLVIGSLIFLRKTWVEINFCKKTYQIPLILIFLGFAMLLWIAENIGSFFLIWQYPYQEKAWQWVGFDKCISWFLLILLSFCLVWTYHKRIEPRKSSK